MRFINESNYAAQKGRALLFLVVTMLVSAGLLLPAHALDLFNKPAAKFLPVEQAFQTVPRQENDTLLVDFIVTPKHYVYEERIKLVLADGSTLTPTQYSLQPNHVDDPEFGRVPVFEQNVRATFALPAGKLTQDAKLKWQGCAKAGLCYPPVTEAVKLKVIETDGEKSVKKKPVGDALAEAKAVHLVDKSNTTQAQAIKKSEPAQAAKPDNTTDKKNTQIKTGQTAQEDVTQQKTAQEHSVNKKTVIQSHDKPLLQSQTSAAPLKTADFKSKELAAVELSGTSAQDAKPQNEAKQSELQQLEPQPTATQEANNLPNLKVASQHGFSTTDDTSFANTSKHSTADIETNPDPFGLAHNKPLGVLLLFFAGLGLAFTPCVLPMLPIVANIVANEHKHSARHGFFLTLSYGIGIALAYGLLGTIVSVVGRQYIIHAMQSPAMLIGFAALFVLLALYLLDVIKLRMPSGVSQFLHRLSQRGQGGLGEAGSFIGSGVAGFFSAIVVSPCVTAPLVGALAGVASVGDPVFGFIALFFLGFGLSVPLIIVGTFEAKLLPEAGEWMNWVKHGFALLLFGVAILLLARVYHTSFILLLWGALTAAIAAWFWLFPNKAAGKWQNATRALALGFGFWAALQLVGAALGNTSPVRPLENLAVTKTNTKPAAQQDVGQTSAAMQQTKNQFGATNAPVIYTLTELDAAKNNHKNLIVDVYADWCVECKIMDNALFKSPPKQMGDWHLVKLDITKANDDAKAVIETLNIFGPPVLAFYKNGDMVALRHGETKRGEFEAVLDELNR